MKNAAVPGKYQTGWLSDLDSRTAVAKEMRERFQELTDDLGGKEYLSYAQRSLCERALWLEYWLASQERALASGQEFNIGQWIQAANGLQGVFSKLGLERRAKDVPDLQDYIRNANAL